MSHTCHGVFCGENASIIKDKNKVWMMLCAGSIALSHNQNSEICCNMTSQPIKIQQLGGDVTDNKNNINSEAAAAATISTNPSSARNRCC